MQNPELDSHVAELTAIRAEAAALLAGIDPGEFNRVPGGGVWSIAQQFEQLLKTGGSFTPIFEREVAALSAADKRATGPFRYNPLERTIIGWMNPTGIRKRIPMPVPHSLEPTIIEGDPAGMAADFDRLQVALLESIRAADGLDLRAANIPSPIDARVRMCLGAWFAAIIAHERYHLNKAKALVAR